MDAAWKVYVGDRRFDDDQISNCFLKMKYETVGRFTFDFRPMDGDESYMQNGRTLRIFWGDLHKMDGVIQRVDWDDDNWCYKVYGADIRGFLLDRVNTEPATVSSYTSDVQSQVMFTGCDFPTNIWTGAGESIGKYTFHYKIGIQNTVRTLGATQTRWEHYTERGTVYDHVNGCLYDATKNWEPNALRGATLRFVSGACKNNVYNINGNTSNRVCIRLPGESPLELTDSITIDGVTYGGALRNAHFETGELSPWTFSDTSLISATVLISEDSYDGSYSCNLRIYPGKWTMNPEADIDQVTATRLMPGSGFITFRMKTDWPTKARTLLTFQNVRFWDFGPYPDWTYVSVAFSNGIEWGTSTLYLGMSPDVRYDHTYTEHNTWIDDLQIYHSSVSASPEGTIPGCSRIGDIYEIVYASMERIDPSPIIPATLEKDNHIIRYNRVNSLSDHTTSMTIRGT